MIFIAPFLQLRVNPRINLKVGEPPTICPFCGDEAKHPVKDDKGNWTWDCKEGCNP
jgi:hypothetical protein